MVNASVFQIVYINKYYGIINTFIQKYINHIFVIVYNFTYLGIMNTAKGSKLNKLLQSMPKGTVVLTSWLRENGYSADLQKVYRKNNWLESIGTGAMIRKGDQVSYEGAVYALQKQANSSVHPGGRSALSLLGRAHFLELSSFNVFLFGAVNEKLPTWYRDYDWETKFQYFSTDFLPPDIGLTELETKNFRIKVSNPARAMMECLYLVPKRQSLLECYEIMEGLNTLKPSAVQQLLESCKSVKVKRLFLYLAEKADHAWFNHIKMESTDLGNGKRSIIAGGAFNSKYQITVDKELEQSNE